jgi:hypothetical protein
MEGGPVADLTEPFGLASLPASIESLAQVIARIARPDAVEERCQTLLL